MLEGHAVRVPFRSDNSVTAATPCRDDRPRRGLGDANRLQDVDMTEAGRGCVRHADRKSVQVELVQPPWSVHTTAGPVPARRRGPAHPRFTRALTLAELATKRPDAPRGPVPTHVAGARLHDVDGSAHAWAMVIDAGGLHRAATPAWSPAKSENNVPVVGPDEIDAPPRSCIGCASTYTTTEHPRVAKPGFQPVPCMHCEHGPLRAGLPGGRLRTRFRGT